MDWFAAYPDRDRAIVLGRQHELPASGLTVVRAYADGHLFFVTVPPPGADRPNLRVRLTSEVGGGSRLFARWWKVGWEPNGPAYAINDGTREVWEADRFHEPCDDACDHPAGWFAPPVPIEGER